MILLALLTVVAFGGAALALTGGEDPSVKALRRLGGVDPGGRPGGVRPANADVAASRRKQILTSLKAAETQQRRTSLTLPSRLQQAGLKPDVRGFWLASLGVAAVLFLAVLIVGHNAPIALGLALAGAAGLPRWGLGLLAKRRAKAFTAAFPDAADVVVRGVKSGLSVHDCLKIAAEESPKPLGDELRLVVEGLGMGRTLDQALARMFTRMPTPEVRFFAITLAIQSKTGGNLAEALNNLSTVLRARKLMREKVKAMAGEAVASASVIGLLPPIIMLLVQLTTPSYMTTLYVTAEGHVLLMIGTVWMGCGVLVMRKIINFRF